MKEREKCAPGGTKHAAVGSLGKVPRKGSGRCQEDARKGRGNIVGRKKEENAVFACKIELF